MKVVTVSQLGIIDEVYTVRAFIEEVQRCVPNYKLTLDDLDKAIDIYVDEVYSDDALTVDVNEVITSLDDEV